MYYSTNIARGLVGLPSDLLELFYCFWNRATAFEDFDNEYLMSGKSHTY